MSRSILMISAALMLWSASATAQDSASAAQQRLAGRLCSSDLSARCDATLGGPDRVRACVKEHLKDLSRPCQASLARLAAVAKACTADIKQDCTGVKRGHGRIELCLESHLADLSDGCKDALAQAAAVSR